MSIPNFSDAISISKDVISYITGCYELINHLSNEAEFNEFRKIYYSDWSENDLLESYIWAIASVYDHFCELIISINFFFNQPYDIKLTRGYYYNVPYTQFCSNFLQGRIIFHIYDFLKNKIFKDTTIKELFASLKELKENLFPFYKIFKEFNLDYDKKHLFFIIESLVWPASGPNIKTRDFFFIQSHFFKDIIDYLNFFKKENGAWICSKGYFFAIAFALYILIGDSLFEKKDTILSLKDVPFEDFSINENGLLFKFSLNRKEGKRDTIDKIHFYSTSEGDLPIYELISSKMKNYRENISGFYKIFEEKLPDKQKVRNRDLEELLTDAIYGRSEKDLIEISNEKIKATIEYLSTYSRFKEKYTLANILDFEDLYSVYHITQIHNNTYFKIISDGVLSYLNDINWQDCIRLMVFHIKINNLEIKANESDIEIITPESSLYFLNKSYEEEENLLFGIYLEVPTGGMIKKDQTYWIGSPLYCSNNKNDLTINLQNFNDLMKFCEKYKKKLEIKSFLVDRNTFDILLRNPKLSFNQPSPFNIIFESGKQIKDHILLNRYKKNYREFLKSFEEEKVSSSLKGAALEKLAESLFSMIQGFRVVGTNIETEAEEIDLLVETNSIGMDIVLEMLGSVFIVECKNWKDKVGASDISSFIEKLNIKNLRGGIIISREGITGKSQDDDARRKIRDLVNRGKIILTLGKEELKEICNGVNPLYLIRKSFYNTYFKGLK